MIVIKSQLQQKTSIIWRFNIVVASSDYKKGKNVPLSAFFYFLFNIKSLFIPKMNCSDSLQSHLHIIFCSIAQQHLK